MLENVNFNYGNLYLEKGYDTWNSGITSAVVGIFGIKLLEILVKNLAFLIFSFACLVQERRQYAGDSVFRRFLDLHSTMPVGRMADRVVGYILKDEL